MNWHPLYLFIYLFIKDDGLFGAEYVKMLNKYSISPDTRVPVKFVEARVENEVSVVEPPVKGSQKTDPTLSTCVFITRIKGETNQFVMKDFANVMIYFIYCLMLRLILKANRMLKLMNIIKLDLLSH